MARTNDVPKPTNAELAILSVLWQNGPSTVREVFDRLPEREVGYTTVLKLLQIMTDKGLVQRDESARSHVYRATRPAAEVKRNLIAGAGGLFRLPRAIGQAAAMEAILTGEPIPAARAYELGLISRLVEPGQAVAAAMELAGKITEAAPLAVWASRKVVLAAAYSDDETLKRMTNEEFAKVMGSEDTKEGLTAFIEKRMPNWQGR